MPKNALAGSDWRCRVVLVIILGCIGYLLAFLWHIQVSHNRQYENDLRRQSMRRIRIPAPRGRIFDRNGVCLADNRPSYCVAVYLEELRQRGRWERTVDDADGVILKMAEILNLDPQVDRADIRMHIRKRLPLPLLVWRDVDQRAVATFFESGLDSSAVDIYVEGVRFYPQGALAAHVLGYVGRADIRKDENDVYDYQMPEMAGKSGVEKGMNTVLAGEAGESSIQVDARGFKHDKVLDRVPSNGQDILLTIDARIQRLAEAALGNDPGAVVVVDPESGDVLALANSPSFDPNDFVPAIPAAKWDQLAQDAHHPLLNRAVSGTYAPGSIFKPIVAIASLENGRASAETEFNCPGYFAIGSKHLNCWNLNGHGRIRLRKALEQSCNSYFAALGLQCGYEYIYHMAEALGLGQKTGVELDNEASGLLPDAAWKRRQLHDGWRDGDTCNVSIGQGPLTVTPIQMALVASAIGNGGRLFHPRLIKGIRAAAASEFITLPTSEPKFMNWSPTTMQVVRGGMYDVIQAPSGTGMRARLPGIDMAGKTGTAQYGAEGSGKKHAWMMIFAPFEKPRYAVAMMVDDAVSGGITIAPRIQKMMQGIFQAEGEAQG